MKWDAFPGSFWVRGSQSYDHSQARRPSGLSPPLEHDDPLLEEASWRSVFFNRSFQEISPRAGTGRATGFDGRDASSRRLQRRWKQDGEKLSHRRASASICCKYGIAAFAPAPDTFDSGRNFAAWLGLEPRQRPTGGKTKLGSVSKMGQTDIRRWLIVGAMSVIRRVVRKGGSP